MRAVRRSRAARHSSAVAISNLTFTVILRCSVLSSHSGPPTKAGCTSVAASGGSVPGIDGMTAGVPRACAWGARLLMEHDAGLRQQPDAAGWPAADLAAANPAAADLAAPDLPEGSASAEADERDRSEEHTSELHSLRHLV